MMPRPRFSSIPIRARVSCPNTLERRPFRGVRCETSRSTSPRCLWSLPRQQWPQRQLPRRLHLLPVGGVGVSMQTLQQVNSAIGRHEQCPLHNLGQRRRERSHHRDMRGKSPGTSVVNSSHWRSHGTNDRVTAVRCRQRWHPTGVPAACKCEIPAGRLAARCRPGSRGVVSKNAHVQSDKSHAAGVCRSLGVMSREVVPFAIGAG
jgi:hypothetical protein